MKKNIRLSFVKTFRVPKLMAWKWIDQLQPPVKQLGPLKWIDRKKTRRSKTWFKLSTLVGDGILGECIAKRY